MRRMLTAVMALMLAASAVGAMAQEGAAAAADEWATLVTANDLDVEGKTPFHLGMTFQLFDMNGKPTKTGSVEEWWAGPGSQKVEVHLAGLNEDGSTPVGADPALVRDAYLVRQLLEAAVHPVPPAPKVRPVSKGTSGEGVAEKISAQLKVAELATKTTKFGKIKLDCTGPKYSYEGAMDARPATMCVEPQTTDVVLLLGLGGKETVVRPRTGKFRDTYVALELQVGIIGRNAVAGKLTVMQSFDPAAAAVKLPAATASQPKVAHASGGVITGNRIRFVEPEYPDEAKFQHMSGSVLLNAIIGKDGVIHRLVPIASTAPMFTDAAIKAVNLWTYRPYLLNGKPTEVDTTITVNFAFNAN
ncbi:MAG: energy transducer TonB [Acidobacteriaceae bacterium]